MLFHIPARSNEGEMNQKNTGVLSLEIYQNICWWSYYYLFIKTLMHMFNKKKLVKTTYCILYLSIHIQDRYPRSNFEVSYDFSNRLLCNFQTTLLITTNSKQHKDEAKRIIVRTYLTITGRSACKGAYRHFKIKSQ